MYTDGVIGKGSREKPSDDSRLTNEDQTKNQNPGKEGINDYEEKICSDYDGGNDDRYYGGYGFG